MSSFSSSSRMSFHIEFINPALVFSRGGRAGDSPRFTGSERGSPPSQGGAPEAETTHFKNEDLERAGCLLPWEEGEEVRI